MQRSTAKARLPFQVGKTWQRIKWIGVLFLTLLSLSSYGEEVTPDSISSLLTSKSFDDKAKAVDLLAASELPQKMQVLEDLLNGRWSTTKKTKRSGLWRKNR